MFVWVLVFQVEVHDKEKHEFEAAGEEIQVVGMSFIFSCFVIGENWLCYFNCVWDSVVTVIKSSSQLRCMVFSLGIAKGGNSKV